MILSFLNILLPGLYCIVVWTYGKAFFADSVWARNLKTLFLSVTVVLHLTYLLIRTVQFNHPPVTTIFEILTVLSFCIAVAYLFIELRSQVRETGYFIINISFFFQLVSTIFIRDLLEVPAVLSSNLFGIHVGTAYAAITISAVYSFLYLMLYHDIKATKFGVIYKKLPTLEKLERMSFTAFKMAFLFLGFAIIAGFLWLPSALIDFSYWDPKLIGTLLLWLLYGGGILAKARGDWKGRRMMVLSVFGFGAAIFSMTIINIFFSEFHRFY